MGFSYKELLAQQKALDLQTASAREGERAAALTRVRSLVDEYQLAPADIFGRKKPRDPANNGRAAVVAKFRDPATGATWSGRGKPPRWIVDQDRGRFLI